MDCLMRASGYLAPRNKLLNPCGLVYALQLLMYETSGAVRFFKLRGLFRRNRMEGVCSAVHGYGTPARRVVVHSRLNVRTFLQMQRTVGHVTPCPLTGRNLWESGHGLEEAVPSSTCPQVPLSRAVAFTSVVRGSLGVPAVA